MGEKQRKKKQKKTRYPQIPRSVKYCAPYLKYLFTSTFNKYTYKRKNNKLNKIIGKNNTVSKVNVLVSTFKKSLFTVHNAYSRKDMIDEEDGEKRKSKSSNFRAHIGETVMNRITFERFDVIEFYH